MNIIKYKNVTAPCDLYSQQMSCVIEAQSEEIEELICSFPVCLQPWRTMMRPCENELKELSARCVNVIFCACVWEYDYVIRRQDYVHISSSTDPEPWRKYCWWLPGRPAGWERLLLNYCIPPVVTLHHRQRYQRRPSDRSRRESSPTFLHAFSILRHTAFHTASTSAEWRTAKWKNILCFHRSR